MASGRTTPTSTGWYQKSLGWTRACPTAPRRANASRPAALPRRGVLGDGAPSVADELREIKALRAEGVLSQEEFDATKARVLELRPPQRPVRDLL